MDEKIELEVMGITYNPIQNGVYALLLREVGGPYRIPIVVGIAEAQSIAMRLDHIEPERPMSHDLTTSILNSFEIELEEVFIYRFAEGVFMSELHLNDGEREIIIDSRTSDAIALALRCNARIYTTREILSLTGVMIQEGENAPVVHAPARKLSDLSDEELQHRIKKCVETENYELAAKIQKILSERTSAPKAND